MVVLAPINQRAGELSAQLLHARVKLCGESKDAIGVLERNVPAKVRRNAALRAIEEARVQLLLQLPDLKSHGRLRHEQRLCRLGERQVFRHGIENLESSIRHEGNRS